MFDSDLTLGEINSEWASYVLDALTQYAVDLSNADEWDLLINRLINGQWEMYTPPIGSILAFAGSTTPAKYLPCDGNNVSRSTYAALFAIIGTTYGAGNGTTTFGTPDLRGRTIIGNGISQTGVTRLRGQMMGAETQVLQLNEIPAHTHSITYRQSNGALAVMGSGASTGNVSTSTGSAGGGLPHANMQPSTVVPYFIYSGI